MSYLAGERSRLLRSNPLEIMPECKTILVLGIRYADPLTANNPPETTDYGRIAAYAWGKDYHNIILDKVDRLVSTIEQYAGRKFSFRCYTDSGPLLEKDLAQRAGLGWIGKNTCLINPVFGSAIFLTEILVDLELEIDPPWQRDACGRCTRCIDACPTHCILPDRTLDASRCISYLTIENKADIPAELRPAIGAWIFGCDVCQTVCPWNRKAHLKQALSSIEPQFLPQRIIAPNLQDEIRLTNEDFYQRYNDSPILRAKRRGFLRNICVAVGNSKNTDAIPDLDRILQFEAEPLIRRHAAWALGEIGGLTAKQILLAAVENEKDASVQAEIQAALTHL